MTFKVFIEQIKEVGGSSGDPMVDAVDKVKGANGVNGSAPPGAEKPNLKIRVKDSLS